MATKCLSQAYKYISAEKPDPNGDYYHIWPSGEEVQLKGQSKTWAIEKQSLENKKTQYKHISYVGYGLWGVAVCVRAWLTRSYFPISLWTPAIFWAAFVVSKKINRDFDPRISTLSHCISRAHTDHIYIEAKKDR